jgi:hypothetical protein
MRIGTLFIIMFFFFGLCNTSRADKIIYHGVTYHLYEYPLLLNSRFKQWNITAIFGENAEDKVINAFDSAPYYCDWIVQNNYIYLQSINGNNTTADLKAVFPEKFDKGLVIADWIDTTLYAPFGKLLYSGGVLFSESIFEYELAFRISKGKIISVEKCDNKKTKPLKDQFHLRDLIQMNINWENLPEGDVKKRTVFVEAISADSLGMIDSVRILKGVNESYDREAIRIVKSIPEWPLIYKHGKVTNWWIFPIIFDRSNKK